MDVCDCFKAFAVCDDHEAFDVCDGLFPCVIAMRFLLCVMTLSLLVCVMDKSYVCSSLNHLLRVVFEMCLPCYHSNESSAVFDGCTDVLQYGKARNKVSAVDTKLVSKFL